MEAHEPTLISCETPGCSQMCAYAYSCHDRRMGRKDAIFWPAIGLAVFVTLGVLALLF